MCFGTLASRKIQTAFQLNPLKSAHQPHEAYNKKWMPRFRWIDEHQYRAYVQQQEGIKTKLVNRMVEGFSKQSTMSAKQCSSRLKSGSSCTRGLSIEAQNSELPNDLPLTGRSGGFTPQMVELSREKGTVGRCFGTPIDIRTHCIG